MKDHRFKFLLLSGILFTFFAAAQFPRHCATMEHLEEQYKKNPQLKKHHHKFQQDVSTLIAKRKSITTKTTGINDTLVIPVVVHIIGNRSDLSIDGYTVTDEQVYSQIDALNRDYARRNADTTLTSAIFKDDAADIKIKFCLATTDYAGNPHSGINRIYKSRNSWAVNGGGEFDMKQGNYWDSKLFLNIWVAKLYDPSLGGTLLGYATFPTGSGLPGMIGEIEEDSTDGVAINFRAFGTVGTLYIDFNLGRTTTHEVGHWLGLFHIWGDEFDCSGTDYCNDTPPCAGPFLEDTCGNSANICSATQRMIENYMDYSVDACMNLFTNDQRDRMRTAMDVSPSRLALRDSYGCCSVVKGDRIPVIEEFESNPINGSGWSSVNYDESSSYTKFWQQASVGYESTSSFFIENDSVFVDSVADRYKDYLETPHFQLNGLNTAVLEFDLAYAAQTENGPTDSLVVMYNGGCSEGMWKVADIYYGSSLTTTGATTNFQPSSASDWTRKRIVFDHLPNSNLVKFRFADYSKGINPLYIDNVNIYRTKAFLEVVFSPNPASSVLRVDVYLPSAEDVTMDIFDSMGRHVLGTSKTSTTSFSEEFYVDVLADGMYIMRVMSGNDTVTKKFVVSH